MPPSDELGDDCGDIVGYTLCPRLALTLRTLHWLSVIGACIIVSYGSTYVDLQVVMHVFVTRWRLFKLYQTAVRIHANKKYS